ncbi:MAG: family 16 glycosylhydrolase [Chlorobi bacterium]|nr:family 16 glycosylhydrolase [Chlorobiota bacterium]
MTNYATRFKLMFKGIPKTSVIEQKRADLFNEYEELKKFTNSDKLKEYNSLVEEVNSEDFKARVQKIKSTKFKDTEEYKKLKEYNKLKKEKNIIAWKKLNGSEALNAFQTMDSSQELKDYLELEVFILSDDFKNLKKDILNTKFKDTEEYKKLKRLKELKKAKDIKNFFKIKDSALLENYNSIEQSGKLALLDFEKIMHSEEFIEAKKSKEFKTTDFFQQFTVYNSFIKSKEYKDYLKLKNSTAFKDFQTLSESDKLKEFDELEKEVNSQEFKEFKAEMEDKNRWKKTEEYKKEQEYLSLKKSKKFKVYFKFKKSQNYKYYTELIDSEQLSNYKELDEYINSDEFKNFKATMEDKNRFKKTEEYATLEKHKLLENDEKIKWFFSVKDSDKFNILKKWKLTFEDNFDNDTLDKDVWLTSFFWGKMMLNESYSLAHDKHLYTDGKNIEINNSILSIQVKNEKAKGKAWNPEFGFMEKEFDFTSGIINTAQSFRQKYGLFEAKVKLSNADNVQNDFWMAGEKMLPHIDIFKFNSLAKKEIITSNFWQAETNKNGFEKNQEKSVIPTLQNDYYIYSLEWTPEKLSWKINDYLIAEQTSGLPDEELFIQFSSGINDSSNQNNLPAGMEIDWIRCYKQNEE